MRMHAFSRKRCECAHFRACNANARICVHALRMLAHARISPHAMRCDANARIKGELMRVRYCTKKDYSRSAIDLSLEQSVNRDAASQMKGIVAFRNSENAMRH